jgi:hypothetical protein
VQVRWEYAVLDVSLHACAQHGAPSFPQVCCEYAVLDEGHIIRNPNGHSSRVLSSGCALHVD